jgi:hypothetical protein
MLKQSSSRMRKGLAVLLVALFVVSLTSVAASAGGGGWHRHGWGHGGGYGHGWGGYGGWGG